MAISDGRADAVSRSWRIFSKNWSATHLLSLPARGRIDAAFELPSYRQHRREHAGLRTQVRAKQERAAAGEATMTIEVIGS